MANSERNLKGRKFGLLKVVSRCFDKTDGEYWNCDCKCGKTTTVLVGNLLSGKTKSCGCLQKQRAKETNAKHGESRTRLYRTWLDMRKRCQNKNVKAYPNYGGRGIKVCDEWQDYETFARWALANGYNDSMTIERKDVDKDYCPENCTWVTLSEQGKNTRKNRYIEYDGNRLTLTEWSELLGGKPNLVTTRLQRGWSETDAVSIPPKKR